MSEHPGLREAEAAATVVACAAWSGFVVLMVGGFRRQFALLSVSLTLVVGAMSGGLSALWTRTDAYAGPR